ncbi:MAG: hypothetical protein J6Y80_02360, partial [Victivallales bacterium]|nr:hypothetical protein [Victivallales bacterium]
EEPATFPNLVNVPPEVQYEYYELTIQGSKIFIRTPFQGGIVWAAQTLSTLFHIMFNGFAVPNLTIRDWPDVPVRGVFTECNWGNERMSRADWYQVVSALSGFKFNTLFLDIYNCVPSCRVSQASMPSEFMMTPVPIAQLDTDLCSLSRFRHYNVKYDRWYDHEVPPAMYEDDFFRDVFNYSRERGVAIYPAFNLLSSSSLLPTVLETVSAKNAKGKATGAGLCLTSKEAREAILGFLGTFLDKYYPRGVKYFHLGLAELNEIHAHEEDGGCESPWCKCPKCKAVSEEKRLADFLEYLIGGLVARGVEKVVIFSNLLDSLKGFRQAVSALLKKPAVKGHLVMDFQDLGNELDKKYLSVCSPKGFPESWLGPLGSRGNFSNYLSCKELVNFGVLAALHHPYQGVVTHFQFDPAYLDHLAVMSARAWEGASSEEETLEELRLRWATLLFGGYAKKFLAALEQLNHAAQNPALQLCLPFPYFFIKFTAKPAKTMLPEYPADALAALAKRKNALKELADCAAEAGEAGAFFARELENVQASRPNENDRMDNPRQEALHSLYASAERIMAYADFFSALLQIKAACAKTGGAKAAGKLASDALARLMQHLQVIEEHLPDWLQWLTMQFLGCDKLVLENLQLQLAKKVPAAKLAWCLPQDWEIPEDK